MPGRAGGDYQRLLVDEGRFHAMVGNKVRPGEHHPEDLLFTVWFCRQPTAEVRNEFVRRMGGWLGSVSARGIHSEGPLLPVSADVEFRGRRANLRLDLSRTGMHTVIWLVLTALELGHAIARVESAVFNYDDPAAAEASVRSMRDAAEYTGSNLTEAEIEQWRVDDAGGPGPSIWVPLAREA